MVTFSIKAKSQIGTPQSVDDSRVHPLPPSLGWQWNMTNAGAASTRGLSYDVNVHRQVETIWSSDGLQSPREIFQGALTASGTYKAIFENNLDLALYNKTFSCRARRRCSSPSAQAAATSPSPCPKSGWSKGTRDWGAQYVQADFTVDGIYNTTDGGALHASVTSFRTPTNPRAHGRAARARPRPSTALAWPLQVPAPLSAQPSHEVTTISGYAARLIHVKFPELSEDPEHDPIFVTIRNPKLHDDGPGPAQHRPARPRRQPVPKARNAALNEIVARLVVIVARLRRLHHMAVNPADRVAARSAPAAAPGHAGTGREAPAAIINRSATRSSNAVNPK